MQCSQLNDMHGTLATAWTFGTQRFGAQPFDVARAVLLLAVSWPMLDDEGPLHRRGR